MRSRRHIFFCPGEKTLRNNSYVVIVILQYLILQNNGDINYFRVTNAG